MSRSAIIEGDYRYELRIWWADACPLLVVCMLNPSTADHMKDDPTTHALKHFADAWGYGGLLIVNLFAFRSPKPSVLAKALYPCGPRNDGVMCDALHYASHHRNRVLVGWGTGKPVDPAKVSGRIDLFEQLCHEWGVEMVCLGTTQDGSPKHPMARGKHRIPRDRQPLHWARKVALP